MVRDRYPAVQTTRDHNELINNSDVDAVAIATPVSTHFNLAMQALHAGKHVFIEKPITETVEQGRRLLDEADRLGLKVHVDHTFVYTGAVRKMRELVSSGELGTLYYFDSVRVNLGLFQPDVSVLWDLAVHDLAILGSIYPDDPIAVSATGVQHIPGKPENIAFLTLFYNTSMIAHVHVNWLAPVKIRRSLIGGSKKMVVYDDLELTEKIKIYEKGVTVEQRGESLYQTLVGYRTGDMLAPKLDASEGLRVEAEHFARFIKDEEQPLSDGLAGLKVVAILEAASASMKARGAPIEVEYGGK